ncbi:hypothetical protein XENTR_v10021338 [Xenopus tropicalis]|nr:hypothetical protein XENTR_v10021338 [Xenopus tropicalis]KAE8585518.1 hypothetical protein XENTR_v10021338 [Xenopus tropicalis]KAE8585519.1 hypothetical protein XENTR_v10021338 [Xenopus tropicalis]
MVVKRNNEEVHSIFSNAPNPIVEQSIHSQDRNDNPLLIREKILELGCKIIQLLTGELFLKEWKYFEEHRNYYRDVITENHQPLNSMGYSNVTPENLQIKQEESSLLKKFKDSQNEIHEVSSQAHLNVNPADELDIKQEGENMMGDSRDCVVIPDDTDQAYLNVNPADDLDIKQEGENMMGESRDCVVIPDDTDQDSDVKEVDGQVAVSPVEGAWMEDDFRQCLYKENSLPSRTSHGRCDIAQGIFANSIKNIIKEQCLTDHDTFLAEGDIQIVQLNHGETEDSGSNSDHTNCLLNKHLNIDIHEASKKNDYYVNTDMGKRTTPCNLITSKTAKNEKPFICLDCGKHFACNTHLTNHMKIHSGERPYSCNECGKSFTRNAHLGRHQASHTGERPFSCSECDKSFTRSSYLIVHQRSHSGEKPFRCEECGKNFTSNTDLLKHQIIHKGDRPYVCGDCGKSYTHGYKFVIHQRTHTGERPFSCNECGKSFISRSNFAAHQKIHTGQGTYICNDCGKSYLSRFHLAIHQRTHTGERPYACSHCGKGFISRADLVRHEVIHRPQRPHVCNQCGKRFTQNTHLVRHQKIHRS